MQHAYIAKVDPARRKEIVRVLNSALHGIGLCASTRPTPANPADYVYTGKGAKKFNDGRCDETAGYYRVYTKLRGGPRIDLEPADLKPIRARLVKRLGARFVNTIWNKSYAPGNRTLSVVTLSLAA
jgi:hypothetical protein